MDYLMVIIGVLFFTVGLLTLAISIHIHADTRWLCDKFWIPTEGVAAQDVMPFDWLPEGLVVAVTWCGLKAADKSGSRVELDVAFPGEEWVKARQVDPESGDLLFPDAHYEVRRVKCMWDEPMTGLKRRPVAA